MIVFCCIVYLYVPTYIICYYNASVRITTEFLAPLMSCVLVLYMSGGTYSLKQIFLKKLFMAVSFSFRVFARSLLRGSRRRNSFLYFRFNVWLGIRTRVSRQVSQHTILKTTVTSMYIIICKLILFQLLLFLITFKVDPNIKAKHHFLHLKLGRHAACNCSRRAM